MLHRVHTKRMNDTGIDWGVWKEAWNVVTGTFYTFTLATGVPDPPPPPHTHPRKWLFQKTCRFEVAGRAWMYTFNTCTSNILLAFIFDTAVAHVNPFRRVYVARVAKPQESVQPLAWKGRFSPSVDLAQPLSVPSGRFHDIQLLSGHWVASVKAT